MKFAFSAGVAWGSAGSLAVALASFSRGLTGGAMGIVAPIAATDAIIPVGLFAIALGAGLLAVIGVLGSFYPVVTFLLAGVVLCERLGPAQRCGAISALAGTAFMAVG